MNTAEILAEAKKRLVEVEAEANRLRAMIAAAEGRSLQAPTWITVPATVPAYPWSVDGIGPGAPYLAPPRFFTDSSLVIGGAQRLSPDIRYAS